MHNTQSKVGIVIPVYNCPEHTILCIDSIFRSKHDAQIKLVVIDNASQLPNYAKVLTLVNYMQQLGHDITLKRSETNLGFAGGINLGLKMLLSDASVTHLCLLNNDTIVGNHCFDELIESAENSLVGPVSNSVGNEQIIIPDYKDLGVNGYTRNLVYKYSDFRLKHFKGDIVETKMLGFFNVLGKRELFEDVGLLDESFGIGYYEDDDYCFRVLQKNYKLLVNRAAYTHHFGSVSFKSLADFNLKKQFSKNRDLFIKKHGVEPAHHPQPLYLAFNQEMSWMKNREMNGEKFISIMALWMDKFNGSEKFKKKAKVFFETFIEKLAHRKYLTRLPKVYLLFKLLASGKLIQFLRPRLSVRKESLIAWIRGKAYLALPKKIKKPLIVFPVQGYFGRKQRPQHIVKELHKLGYDIIWVEPSFSKIQKKSSLKREDGISIFTPANIDFAPFYHSSIENPHELYEQLQRYCTGLKIDISQCPLIIQSVFWTPILKEKWGQKIFDCMDLHSDFGSSTFYIESLEKEIFEEVDGVIFSSQYLSDLFNKKDSAKSAVISNACDTSHFSMIPHEQRQKVVVGYFGAIAEWFDVELICEVAKRKPEWTFELIGAINYSAFEHTVIPKNVILLGERKYHDLPKLVSHWSVATIPFKLSKLILATNPVKLYEYSALGLPVVTTAIPEVTNAPITTYTATNADTFIEMVSEAIQQDSDENRKLRREFAAQNSWAHRAQKTQNFLESLS